MADSQASSSSAVDELVKSGASFGVMMAKVWATIVTIIGLVVIGFGIKGIVNPSHDRSTSGSVKTASCNTLSSSMNECNVSAEYNVNGTIHSVNGIVTNRIQYKPGDSIDVYYDPAKPQSSQLTRPITKKTGIIMITVSVLVIALFWGLVYLAKRNTFVAGMFALRTLR